MLFREINRLPFGIVFVCLLGWVLANEECTTICEGTFELNSETCQCVCSIKCLDGKRVDYDTCSCISELCGPDEAFNGDVCVPHVKTLCPENQIMLRDVCVNEQFCPPGYLLEENRLCKRECCRGPCAYDQEKCGPESCGQDMYIIEGECKHVEKTECPSGAFFNLNKPRCAKTCDEPVQLSVCDKKWTGPGCSCLPGLLLHDGECIHPESCPNKPICLKDADILIMLDSSVSIGEENYKIMTSFAQFLIERLDVADGEHNRVSVVTFSHQIAPVLQFSDYQNISQREMLHRVANLTYSPGLTYMGEALHFVRNNQLSKENGLRQNSSRVLILLTDGTDTNGELDADYEAQLIREMGVQVLVLKLGGQDREQRERLYRLAGEDGKIFVFGLRHFRDIAPVVERVADFECTKIMCPRPRLIAKACENEFRQFDREEFIVEGTKCVSTVVENAVKRRCACPADTTETTPCVDQYHNITVKSYTFVKKKSICEESISVERQICSCPMADTSVGPCVGQFQKEKILSYRLERDEREKPYCQEAVNETMVRCACPQPVLKTKDCIGGFKVVRKTEYVFEDFTKTCREKSSEEEVRCNCPVPSVSTKRCTNDAIEVLVNFQTLTKNKECRVDTYVGHEACKIFCGDKIDVGIIVDTSSSMLENQFLMVKQFIRSLVGTMHIGEDETRVTILTYSSEDKIRLISDFFTFFHVEALQQRIDDLKYVTGSTSTGEALEEYRRSALLKSHGSRIHENVTQIVYLITDGLSNGEVDPLNEAMLLKAMGVTIIVVAISEDVHHDTVMAIASEPSSYNVFFLQDFEDLQGKVNEVSSRMCKLQNGVNPVTVREKYENLLVYLEIDESVKSTDLLEIEDFRNFLKVDNTNYCHLTIFVKGFLSVIAGGEEVSMLKFEERCIQKLAETMKIDVLDIRNFKYAAMDQEEKVALDFDIGCPDGKKLIKALSKGTFSLNTEKLGPVNVLSSYVLINSDTRKAVEATKKAHETTSTLVNAILKAVEDPDFQATAVTSLETVVQWVARLPSLMTVSEDRMLRLCSEIQKEDLKLIESARDAVADVEDPDIKEALLSKLENFGGKVLSLVDSALTREDKARESSGKVVQQTGTIDKPVS